MSKIAELLKLAEKKKEKENHFDSVANASVNTASNQNNVNNSDGVSKSNQEQVSVSKSKSKKINKNKTSRETVETEKTEISPTRNFTKVSNSITKRAIPEKYFRGLSKHTYDVLYQRTRGAVTPTRTIQLTKDELVRLTGISKDAVKLHIKYLKEIGLLESRPAIGIHAGWEYEIFVPEEIKETVQLGVSRSKVSRGNWGQNLPLDTVQVLPLVTPTNTVGNKGTYGFPNTSFKTNTKNDDERRAALFALTEKLDAVSRKLTGKGLSSGEIENWGSFADLIILELEIAAKKTNFISSVPAFLTEVLRRHFLISRQQTASAGFGKTKPDTVGQFKSGSYEIKSLDEKGREAALEYLREFAEDEFLADFKKWYTEKDWKWLVKQLGKIQT